LPKLTRVVLSSKAFLREAEASPDYVSSWPNWCVSLASVFITLYNAFKRT